MGQATKPFVVFSTQTMHVQLERDTRETISHGVIGISIDLIDRASHDGEWKNLSIDDIRSSLIEI